MADPVSAPKRSNKSLPTLATELWELVLAYAKQETLEPLKNLGRFLGYGLAGAVLLATGLLLLGIGGLRVLQVETAPHFTGNLTWVPYLITVAVSALIAVLVVSRIGAVKRRSRP